MRLFRVSLVLLVCFVIGHSAEAQVSDACVGYAVGEPAAAEYFNTSGPLPPGQTNDLVYKSGDCPGDGGGYVIVSSFNNPCRSPWHRVPSDHTGNGGYMMVVNASIEKSLFYTKEVTTLCPGTLYSFSVYVLDLMRPDASDATVAHPILRFVIEDADGNQLNDPDDAVRYVSATNTAEFRPYGITFSTPNDVSKIVLKIYNDSQAQNGNDFILDDITFRACGPPVAINVDGYASGATLAVCEGKNNTFKFNTSAPAGYAYQWQHFENGNWLNIPEATDKSYIVSTATLDAGLHQYRLALTQGMNVDCRSYANAPSVQVNPLPVISNINDESVCENADITLRPAGGATYTLTGPGVNRTRVTSPFTLNNLTLANSGTYTIRATSAAGCEGPPQSFNITVKRDFTVTATASANEVCKGTAVNLSAGPDEAGYTYKWTPSTGLNRDDIANPVATPLTTTAYTVTVSNGSCAYPSSPATIRVLQPPLASIASRKVIFEGQSLQLKPTVSGDITTYSWWPETGLSDPHILKPIASPTDDITYTLMVNSALCEPDTAVIFVKVYKTVTIPNTFTPNADGVNDIWNIEALTTYPESETHVYNRNGQEVFRSIGYSKAWNGTFNGQPLPVGTYYYIIDLKNNTAKRTGYVTILR